MNSATTPSARTRAAFAAALFSAFGVGFAWKGISDWSVSAPLVLFYGILVANTFFSVRCFAAVVPLGNRVQGGVDLVLVVAYAWLAASLGDSIRFACVAAVLFAVSTAKYALLVGRAGLTELLARKIRVNALGLVACTWALSAMLAGHAREASWSLAAAFAAANIYVLWVRPMYRIPVGYDSEGLV